MYFIDFDNGFPSSDLLKCLLLCPFRLPYIVLNEKNISFSFFLRFPLRPCHILLAVSFNTLPAAGISADFAAFPQFCPSSLFCIRLPKNDAAPFTATGSVKRRLCRAP